MNETPQQITQRINRRVKIPLGNQDFVTGARVLLDDNNQSALECDASGNLIATRSGQVVVDEQGNLLPDQATSSDVSSLTNAGYNVSTWGDSLTFGFGPGNVPSGTSWPTLLTPLLGNRHVDNYGVPGYTSAQILAVMQGHADKWRGLSIIWAGRNDISVNSNATILANIAAMVALIPAPQNFAVLSVTNSRGEPAGSTNYNQIVALNASLSATYGAHYLDLRAALVAQGNSSDIASDIIPSVYQPSDVHFTPAGYAAIAAFLAANASAYGGGQALVTNTGVGAILANGSTVGSNTAPAQGTFAYLGVGPLAGNDLHYTAGFQSVKPSGTDVAMKLSSPFVAAGDRVLFLSTYNAGNDTGINNNVNGALGFITAAGGGGDVVLYTANADNTLTERLHVTRDGTMTLTATTISAAANLTLTSPSGSYPSTLSFESTAWNGSDGNEGAGWHYVGTKNGAVNGVQMAMRAYGSAGLAFRATGDLAAASGGESAADMLLNLLGKLVAALPEADPHKAGAPYWSGSTLMKSAG